MSECEFEKEVTANEQMGLGKVSKWGKGARERKGGDSK
jgi:hypothetical protein